MQNSSIFTCTTVNSVVISYMTSLHVKHFHVYVCVFASKSLLYNRPTSSGMKSPDLGCKESLAASFLNSAVRTIQSPDTSVTNKCKCNQLGHVMKRNTDVRNFYLPNLRFCSLLCSIHSYIVYCRPIWGTQTVQYDVHSH